MPSSRFLIESQILSTSAASVTFSNIPATYTDLIIKVNARVDYASEQGDLNLTINSISSGYSRVRLYGTGSSAGSDTNGPDAFYAGWTNGSLATSNTFSTNEIYIPNYTSSNYKVFSSFGAAERNTTASFMSIEAGFLTNTASISSITINDPYSSNFVAG